MSHGKSDSGVGVLDVCACNFGLPIVGESVFFQATGCSRPFGWSPFFFFPPYFVIVAAYSVDMLGAGTFWISRSGIQKELGQVIRNAE